MTTTTLIALNAVFMALVVAGVFAVVRFAHKLPHAAPHDDATWGLGDARVPNDPLPLRQLAEREDEREAALAPERELVRAA